MEPAHKIIADYVIAVRAHGVFLNYREQAMINEWLELCPDPDRLLLVLDGVLPEFFAKHQKQRLPPSLRLVHRRVKQMIGQGFALGSG